MIFMVQTMRYIVTIKIKITNEDDPNEKRRAIVVYPSHADENSIYARIVMPDHSATFWVWDEQSLVIKEIQIEPEIITLNKGE